MEELLGAGALDVFFTPIYMKKCRPAVKLSFLAYEDKVELLEKILFKETSTIGIRKVIMERTVMERSFDILETRFGNITVKKLSYQDIAKSYGEYEDVKKAAIKHKVSVQEVHDEVKYMIRQGKEMD